MKKLPPGLAPAPVESAFEKWKRGPAGQSAMGFKRTMAPKESNPDLTRARKQGK